MDWFWHVLVVCAVVVPVTVMWIAILVELFRRHDLSGLARATWLVLLFVLPLIGSFLYLIVTWRSGEGDREVSKAQGTGHALGGGRGRHTSEGSP